MDNREILASFFTRREIFDNYLKVNKLQLHTCPGCGYPTITERGEFDICMICGWEDDGRDDNTQGPLDPFLQKHNIAGPNGRLTLTENRINIGRLLQQIAERSNGAIDLDAANVLKIIESHRSLRDEIADKMTGDEHQNHPLWTEWDNVRTSLRLALIKQSSR